jgi:hypothetical protein
MPPKSFFAYPAQPEELADTVRRALERARTVYGAGHISGWEENDIAGRPLTDPIFAEIANRLALFADVTFLNFNVAYEIGYAIGQNKRVFLVMNSALDGDASEFHKVGIFDTYGYKRYRNNEELYELLNSLEDATPTKTDFALNLASPIYYLGAEANSDYLMHLFSRIKKTKYRFRNFDPHEQPRLPAARLSLLRQGPVRAAAPELNDHGTLYRLLSNSIGGAATPSVCRRRRLGDHLGLDQAGLRRLQCSGADAVEQPLESSPHLVYVDPGRLCERRVVLQQRIGAGQPRLQILLLVAHNAFEKLSRCSLKARGIAPDFVDRAHLGDRAARWCRQPSRLPSAPAIADLVSGLEPGRVARIGVRHARKISGNEADCSLSKGGPSSGERNTCCF